MFNTKRKAINFSALLIFGLIFFMNIYGAIGTIPTESSNEIGANTEELIDTEVPVYDDTPIIDTGVEPIDFTGEEFFEPDNYDRAAIDWRPIEETLKIVQLNAEAAGGSIATASYDVKTGVETIIEPEFLPSPESSQETIRSVEPYEGLLGEMSAESVVNNPAGDQRTIISGQNVFPWRTIVKLYISTSWGNYVGSGAVIDNFHILTAGHCAYVRDSPNFGWATSIEVVPAFDNLDNPSDPYGHAWVTGMRSYTGWTSSGSTGHDWAVLTLDRNVGAFTGWMGRTTAGSGSSIYTGIMNVAGYPTDVAGGNRLAFDSNNGNGATSLSHSYWADTAGGESGGPVWRYVSGNRYIMTTHAYGSSGDLPSNPNSGTRLNTDKYDRIFTWLGEDAGSAPTDKADLVDRGSAYDSITSGTWTATTTSVTLTNGIRNVGTASSGNYYVHYYASTNDYISTFDYYIGTSTLESTLAFGTDGATFTGTLPDIPAGLYYIGWIIDNDDTVDEFDETNNRAVFASQKTILGAPPPSGYIEVTVRDSITSSLISSAYVSVKDGTDTIIDTGWTDGSGFYNVTGLDIGWHTIDVSKVGYYDQQKVDYINWEGDDDYLTFYMVPMPPDSSYIEVNVRDSVTSSGIVSAYVQTVNMSSGLVIDTGWTNGASFYNVTGLYIGWYEVTISKSGYRTQTKQNYINWNGDDDYLTFYLVEMPATSGYIEVRTYNETGEPLAGVYVRAWNNSGLTLVSSGFTNINGTYNITGLVIGWYEVNVTYLAYQEQSKSDFINWNGDDDYLSFWMVPNPPDSGYIDVSVFDSGSGLPISWAKVEVTNQSSGLVIQTGYTDTSGIYKVVNLTIGWFTIDVTKEGYHAQSKPDYINWAGDDDYLSFYMVELPPDSGYIEVTVRDDDTAAPIQGILVTCYYSNGTYFSSGYTDSSGFFNITGLYIGWYDVEVSHTDYGGETLSDYINWNGDDDYLMFYLVIAPPGWIEVNVYDSVSYNPIENAFVRCFNTTSGVLFTSGYTNSAGFYNITGLLIGWWTVNVTYPGYYEGSQMDYINWRGDDDYLTFYLVRDFNPLLGPVAIFRDIIPWFLNATEPILEDYGIPYTVFDSSDMGVVDLSSYQKVIIASDQPQTFYQAMGNNLTWFENYVLSGGVMQIHAADDGWETGYWSKLFLMPGGVNKTQIYEWRVVSANMTQHPILQAPFPIEGAELDSWIGGYFIEYPTSASVILSDPSSGEPILLEFPFGSGHVILSTHTLEWNQFYNLSKLLVNMVLFDPLLALDTITVTSPISSSSWEVPTTHTITWDSTGTISNVKIDLYKNGVFLMEIELSTPNDGAYSWDIPIGLSDSVLYQVRVSDAAYTLTKDDSDNFEIFDLRTITVTSPISGDHWIMGNDYFINWTSTGTIANVMIELYASSILVLEIAASTPNDGLFSWSIPNTLVNFTEYVIRVSDLLDPTLFDDSGLFTITGEDGGGIPGYDVLILGGLLGVVSLVIIKRKRKKLSIS